MRFAFLLLVAIKALFGEAHAKERTPSIIEWAPLRAMGGDLALSGELGLNTFVAARVSYEAWDATGERDNQHDNHQKYGAGAVVLPRWALLPNLFVGAGLAMESATLYRVARRDGTTWVRTSVDDIHDTWVNQDTYYSAYQEIGYRVTFMGWATASARLLVDQVLGSSSQNVATDVQSHALRLDSKGRPPVQKTISVHLGLAIP